MQNRFRFQLRKKSLVLGRLFEGKQRHLFETPETQGGVCAADRGAFDNVIAQGIRGSSPSKQKPIDHKAPNAKDRSEERQSMQRQ